MTRLLSPYPGLRPFEVDEAHLFFGREDQTDELLQHLHATHFLAVVGPSGCGKSSLVRAGMIASLNAGFMVAAGARWQFAIMRPENRPMHGLARALIEQTGIGSGEDDKEIATGFLEATLRRGPLGVVEALRDVPLPAGTNLLILVDQFEEIFRFAREGGHDEADAFVSLLLETARQREAPVYVVITMRSDFFGDCAIFEGLPEALNESQYLTPRLTREQRRDAIVGPARVFGGDVAPDLVNRLLNQMGTDPDQLPLMQHLLMRMWTWRDGADAGLGSADTESEVGAIGGRELTIADCDAVGGLDSALSRHADEAFEELDDRQKAIAETLFRTLSERAPGNRDIRHPAPAGEVAELAGTSLDRLVAVVETFRAPGRSFIVPPVPEPISAERILDITHESLIRQWDRLRDWAEEEEKSAETYRRLAQTASQWQQRKSALWQSPDLEMALDWQAREQPTALWAKRYGGDFELATTFLGESERARQAREAETAAKRRAEVRRWRLISASASALALLLLVAGIFFYEAEFAEQVGYYKTFGKRFGEPFGIDRLSRDQIRHRPSSLKLVRRGFLNPVIGMEAVDADGNCTPHNSVGTYLQQQINALPLHECRWEFVYDNKGQVVYEKAYDKEGRLRWGYSYTPSEQQARYRTAYYVAGDGFPAPFENSLAEILHIEYSDRGYEIRRTYTDRQRRPQPGQDRAYGQEIAYDEQGRVTRMTSLDQFGRKMDDTAGNAIFLGAYDRLGNEIDNKALGKDGKPILVKGGWYEMRRRYDENGNPVSEAYFDRSGHPTVLKDGVHLYRMNYDENGYIKEIRYYDTKRNPTASTNGYHKIVYIERDKYGNQQQWAFFEIDGRKATDPDGVHEYRQTYDARGFPKSLAAFDREGRPTIGKRGYHRIEWQYDRSGNAAWEAYFDRSGRPTHDVDGVARMHFAHDDRGHIREWIFFGPDGRPTMTNDGYYRKTAQYSAAGFDIEEALFGKHGESVNGKAGYHKTKMSYDLRGNQTEISYFDTHGKAVLGSEKFAHLTRKYDARDNTIEWAYYGADGRLTDRGERCAIRQQWYDDRDREIQWACYNDRGRLTAGPQGYATTRWRYDGNWKDESHYDPADHEIAYNGCMAWRSILDLRTGKQIEGVCLDASGRPVRSTSGAAFVRSKYDDHGREIEAAWYREDRHLALSPNYAIRRRQYDDRGNLVEEAYFGEDGKLLLGPDGYAFFQSKYDDRREQTEVAYYGEDGKLRLHPKFGYAISRAKYDDRGNLVEAKFFGKDERLRIGPDGFAIARAEYDDSGRQIELAYFGDDGNLRFDPKFGFAIRQRKYDDPGHLVGEKFFGEDGKLRLGPDGYAIMRAQYDDRGRETEVAYFGEDGKLRLPTWLSYARERAKYDDRGNLIEEDFFGIDGKLRDEANDFAIDRMKYDDQGGRTEAAFFGADGALSNSGQGFAAITKRMEIIVRDEKGALTARCGNSEIADFLMRPKLCSDGNDKPLVSHPVVLYVLPGSPAQGLGLQNGDVIEDYDGKPVFIPQELVKLIKQQGQGTRRVDIIRQGRRLAFEAPAGRLGIRIGLTFVPADQPMPDRHADWGHSGRFPPAFTAVNPLD